MSGKIRNPITITGNIEPNQYHDNTIIENGKIVKCPYCGSTDVEVVQPFDYIKQCNNCRREFMSEEHN